MLVKQLALLERRARAARPAAASERWAGGGAPARADALVQAVGAQQAARPVRRHRERRAGRRRLDVGRAGAGRAWRWRPRSCKEPRYLQVAKAIGEHYYDRFVRVGLTCGGPGDALQAPDSESAAALLDSFVTLYEATRDRVWIDRARAAAHLLASWVISYDAPRGRARLRRLGRARDRRRASGARGSAPRLARIRAVVGRRAASPLPGDRRRRAARAAARHRPQPGAVPAARRRRRPAARRDGARRRACSRADTGRWLEPRDSVVPADGVFDAIGLLSYTEVPGIYVRARHRLRVRVRPRHGAHQGTRRAGGWSLTIANPTARRRDRPHPRRRRAADAAEPLRPGAVLDAQTAVVPAGGSVAGERAAAVKRPLTPTLAPLRGARE